MELKNPLTDADLDDLTAYWRDAHEYAKSGGNYPPSITGRALADVTALLAAVREARALARVAFTHWPAIQTIRNQRGEDDGQRCSECKVVLYNAYDGERRDHAPDCAWQAARGAVEEWKGEQ